MHPFSSPHDPRAAVQGYREFPPSSRLARHVECYWLITAAADTPPAPHRVLPDGCIDIIISLGSPALRGPHPMTGSSVVGAMRTPLISTISAGACHLGIRFAPGGAAPLFSLPMRELTDLAAPLDELWRGAGEEFEERITTARDSHEALARVDEMLQRRLRRSERCDATVPAAVAMIRRARGGMAIGTLERTLGISGRHLERKFHHAIGLTPKLFSRVIRFQHAIGQLQEAPLLDWSELLYRSGYFDQAHLIREFNQFAGLSPEAYRREWRRDVGSVQSSPSPIG